MATLYFNDAEEDSDVATLENWWEDAECTVQADALPGVNDDCIFLASVYVNSGDPFVVASVDMQVEWGEFAIDATAGLFSFSGDGCGPAFGFTINGDCVFNGEGGGAYGAIINGDCEFSGEGGVNFHTTVNGDCVFSGEFTNNVGTINGDCYLLHPTSANGSVDLINPTYNTEGFVNGRVFLIRGSNLYGKPTEGFVVPRGINGSSILGVM